VAGAGELGWVEGVTMMAWSRDFVLFKVCVGGVVTLAAGRFVKSDVSQS